MSNSRVISSSFAFISPDTLESALDALSREDARVLAGGTDLLNLIKTGDLDPAGLVYVLNIPELAEIRYEGGLVIGAAARLADIEAHPQVQSRYPSLKEAINVIGGTQIRNMATLGGNLCNASPGADTPLPLIVLDAQVELAWIGGKEGAGSVQRRQLPLQDFFSGPKQTALQPGQMLVSISIPEPATDSGQSFRRLARVRLDIAKINCAVYLQREGDAITLIRVAMGSVAATPVRAPTVEAALHGQTAGEALFRQAAELVNEDIKPIDDIRSTQVYRRRVAPVLVREALAEAWQRAGGA